MGSLSSDVAAGDTIQIEDINLLREDVVDEVTGHKHTGVADEGRKVDFADAGDLTIVTKSADETVNNSNSLQNDDDLVFAVGTNELWYVEYTLIFQAGVTPDIKFAVTVPTSATARATTIRQLSSSIDWDNRDFVGGVVDHDGQGATTSVILIIRVHIDTAGTAGNIQLQWAQTTATSEDTKVLKGSRLIARQIE